MTDAAMLIAGEWAHGSQTIPVQSPYTGDVVGTVPAASRKDVDRALEAAVHGAAAMSALTAAERAGLLEAAADGCEEAADELAGLIVAEQGKTIREARRETARMPALLRLCAGEALRIAGETLPLDASADPDGRGKHGLTLRVPAGVVVAITPFNYPLLLVGHKVGPALAAGNAVILKPSTLTPLTALRFVGLLLEAGFPAQSVQCVTGPGATIGEQLSSDHRVRVVTFTGSVEVGHSIASCAGVKRLLLELGANCPVVVMPDADIGIASAGIAVGGYANAGQVCISAQRILVSADLYSEFLDDLTSRVGRIRAGDPTQLDSEMGPLISVSERERVASVIDEAVAAGSRVLTGGEGEGALYAPTVVADVAPETRLFQQELFGPAVAVTPFRDLDEALELVNTSSYGLSASVFTSDLDTAFRFARAAEAGNVHINNSPLWRADAMPYGGLKESGIGKEGPRYAIEEMTETKAVIFHTRDGP